MAQPDNSARRSPRRRADSTHPAPARPGGHRGGDRRPWPTAPTTTRVSPGKPAKSTAGTGSRSRGSASTPTPATVWTAGSAPIELDATWPATLVERIVTSFSKPAERVVLLDWPISERTRPTLGVVGTDGVIDHAPGAEPDPELADTIAAVERLDRAARVERVPIDPASTGPTSRPFWADLVGGVGTAPATIPTAPEVTVEVPFPDAVSEPVDGAGLIVTSLPPHRSGHLGHGNTADLIALYAARRLRIGGILVVLTHCDWELGELTDPTGAVVTAGQNADLLYLQHIVALHTPVRDGRFHLADAHSDGVHGDRDTDTDTDDGDARARHRALVRGLPAPHRRIHSDVLVFAQPHDHQPTPPASPSAPTDAVPQSEDIR
ncbi:hypothetical protein F4560_008657 [Saccharothrix ecbatanensis]|uniref:Uncharacterized protein n=1 Tax=Saccharothrix ecbatanensis TaxID=1105145 RepID=A0A7W9M6F7_9PSEU|nr:hypothetical protein [Saccharothrix ecbatanensis]MBB5808889.1 hypothetical protein [Saccharothrix ecbatanensis]